MLTSTVDPLDAPPGALMESGLPYGSDRSASFQSLVLLPLRVTSLMSKYEVSRMISSDSFSVIDSKKRVTVPVRRCFLKSMLKSAMVCFVFPGPGQRVLMD